MTSPSKKLASALRNDFEECWKYAHESVLQNTVKHSQSNCQISIHLFLLISTFLDPRPKGLPSVDVGSKAEMEKEILKLMNESETEHHHNNTLATADVEIAKAEGREADEKIDSDNNDVLYLLK